MKVRSLSLHYKEDVLVNFFYFVIFVFLLFTYVHTYINKPTYLHTHTQTLTHRLIEDWSELKNQDKTIVSLSLLPA